MQANKVIVLLGARLVGKTESIKKLMGKVLEKVLFLNGDDIKSPNLLEIQSTANFKRLLGDRKLLIIDEA
ncbi:AAA family ATPase [Flavobacterium caseinilyticum]|uniref:AAA family ATPase n=1 Tax=Flavobacterium caseinilyticum TaxID=2541732 RepID=UPI001FB7B754|nr:AAA family ATPase [Flavobacterium caseinilyticum]